MEIACTRSSHDLFAAKQAYHVRYKKSLEEDVAYHTSGDYRKVFLSNLIKFFIYILQTSVIAIDEIVYYYKLIVAAFGSSRECTPI